MKKAFALVLALAMLCALAAPAMAADSDSKTVTNGDGQEVWLNGETKKDAALISVVMPTAINFQVATKADTDGSTLVLDDSDPGTGGVVSGTGKFTNNSNRSVALTLAEVNDAVVADSVGFLTVLDVYLAPANMTRADVFASTSPSYKLGTAVKDAALGTMGLNGTLEFKIFAKDNEGDTTSLPDGKYQIRTVMKVSAVTA